MGWKSLTYIVWLHKLLILSSKLYYQNTYTKWATHKITVKFNMIVLNHVYLNLVVMVCGVWKAFEACRFCGDLGTLDQSNVVYSMTERRRWRTVMACSSLLNAGLQMEIILNCKFFNCLPTFLSNLTCKIWIILPIKHCYERVVIL